MKIMFVSLGCDKNLVDTEMMIGQLSERGYEFTNDETEAEAVVINTCSFIHDAKEESVNTIIEMGALRREGKLKALIVTGCLAQRYEEEIKTELPEVDAVLGTMAIDEIVSALERVLEGEKVYIKKPLDGPIVYGKKRLLTTGGHFAYLKIAEGCGKHCTYCAIPSMRGTYRSVPMEVLINEAKTLADSGVKELILVAQETTLYGVDLYGNKMLPKLLRKLSEIENLYFIRILYCYPEEITDELIEEMKTNPKVCHYLDIPIQHASDAVLKRMGRRATHDSLVEEIGKLRKEIPDIALRTSLISGFPGETHKDFIKLYEFVNAIKFDRLGVFTYSKEEGTAAAKMKGQRPEWLKKLRRNKLMKLQAGIAYEKALAEVGRVLTVMVEGKLPEEGVYVTRTYKDAPNVDGYLFLETSKELVSGDLIKVRVTGAQNYDLMGVPEDEFTE